jgi:hypothetical protein
VMELKISDYRMSKIIIRGAILFFRPDTGPGGGLRLVQAGAWRREQGRGPVGGLQFCSVGDRV